MPDRLTDKELETFKTLVERVVAIDEANHKLENWDNVLVLLNDLFSRSDVHKYDFRRFTEIVKDANDSECRCPK